MSLSPLIAERISNEHHLDKATAAKIVDLVLRQVAQAVAGGDKVILADVGTLRAEIMPERRDHHPSTGAVITIPAAARVVFEPAS